MSDALGVAAAAWGVLMAISPTLQIRRILDRRSSEDISISYLAVLQIGFMLWVGYGSRSETPRSSCPTAWPSGRRGHDRRCPSATELPLVIQQANHERDPRRLSSSESSPRAVATFDIAGIYLGDRLGWYRSLADDGPATPMSSPLAPGPMRATRANG